MSRRVRGPSLFDALWWLLAATIAGLAAVLLWTVVTPVSPLGAWQPAGVRVMSPAARAALFTSFDPFNRGAPVVPTTGGETITSLPLTLFGVRINAATGGGSAIIAGADGIQKVYRTGSEVMPGVVLAAVRFDHVGLSHNGNTELLYLDQSKPAASAQPALASTSPGLVAPPPPPQPPAPGPLTMESVRQGISVQPRTENGRVTGLDVNPASDGRAFRAAGFQAGDVITSVAGKPVRGAADAASLVGALKPGASVAVTVRRGGQQLPLAITLPQ